MSSPRPLLSASRQPEGQGFGDFRQPSSFHGAEINSNDDMSGSESHHSPSISTGHQAPQQHTPAPAPVQQPQQILHHQRRSQDQPAPQLDGRIPQYLVPINNRRVVLNNRPPVSIPTAPVQPQGPPSTSAPATTTAASTTTTTTTTRSPLIRGDFNRISAGIASTSDDKDLSEEEQPTRGNDNSADQVSSTAKTEDPMATAASSTESTVVNEDAASSDSNGSAAPSNDQSAMGDQSAEASEIKPSVQGGDEELNEAAKQQPSPISSGSSQQGQSAQSSLKTVEVEIPANDDAQANGPRGNAFNSVRLSSGDLGNANAAFEAMFETKEQRAKAIPPADQIIQPRDQQSSGSESDADKRDKDGDNNYGGYDTAAASLMSSANGRNRFGTRSSSQSQPAKPESQSSPANHLSNHQMSSVDQPQPTGDSSRVDQSSSILMDRSDESNVDNGPVDNKPMASSDADSSPAAEDGPAIAGRVKPVVGTDELASGPPHLEDRMGASAQSLEEALNKLQHQLPQSAALVGSNQAEAVPAAESKNDQVKSEGEMAQNQQPQQQLYQQPMQQQLQQNPPSPNMMNIAQMASTEDRSDSRGDLKQVGSKNPISPEPNQPHPNVYGQAKVIPDPTNSLSTRGSMIPQASGVEGVRVPAPANFPAGQMQKQAQQQQQQQQISMQQPSGAIAQVTTIPMGFNLPQSQQQSIQQLSQQLAQQFQQQQAMTTSTTAKPSRGRFSLLAPHTAIQAVASRLLPKSSSANQQQQIQLPQLAQQANQLFQNFKQLPPEQQQLLAATAKSSPLVNSFFKSASVQQPQFQQQTASPQPQSSTSSGIASGLFARFRHSNNNNNQASARNGQNQPLIRTRRSAMMPSKNSKGTGELGLTKTFMVVTNMDLAFAPNLTDSDLPEVLEGRRAVRQEDEVIYGVCMPIVSLTFVLTCAFWLFVFILSFCVYTWIKTRRHGSQIENAKLGVDNN